MQLDNFTADGIEILKNETTPYGCIRIYWSTTDEHDELKTGYTDFTITQDFNISTFSGEPFIIVEDEYDIENNNKDFARQILGSLADKII